MENAKAVAMISVKVRKSLKMQMRFGFTNIVLKNWWIYLKSYIHCLFIFNMLINPVDLLLWTFRRNENDVVKLYDALSPIMEVSTDGDMLNFGYWDDSTIHPVDAQTRLCHMIGDLAQISSADVIADIGCGILGPAKIWSSQYPSLQISSVNVNFSQLASVDSGHISKLNSTARMLPFTDSSLDRIIALESAQHFKPLGDFISESNRVLKDDGILALAIPTATDDSSLSNLGILKFTWSSEHYSEKHILEKISQNGFEIVDSQDIGKNVYSPLAEYYINNRDELRKKILTRYSKYVEKILFESMKKMQSSSEKGLIGYLMLKCKKLALGSL